LTGRYPFNTIQEFPEGNAGTQLSYTMLPALLKKAGYRSHQLGKWHQGYWAKEYTPAYRGFDTSLGYLCVSKFDHWGDPGKATYANCTGTDWWNTYDPPKQNYSGIHIADVIANSAVDIITNHPPSIPLYLHAAFYNIHEPIQEDQKYIDLYPNIQDK